MEGSSAVRPPAKLFRVRYLALAGWLAAACAATVREPPASAEPLRHRGAAAAGSASAVGHDLRKTIAADSAERVARLWEVAAGGSGRAVAVNRGAKLVAYSSGSTVRLHELGSGALLWELSLGSEILRGGLGFRNGKLYVACVSKVAAIDSRTRKPTAGLDVASAPMTAVAFQGEWLAAGHTDGVVRIYSLVGGETREIPVPGPPIDVKSLALTPDGRRVAVAWVQGSIWWWNVAEPGSPTPLVRYLHESDALAFSNDGQLLAEEGEEQQTTLWSFGDRPTKLMALRQGAWVKRILMTRDRKWLVRAGSDGLELAEIAGPRRIELDARAPVEDAAFDEETSLIAAADRAGRLILYGVKG